MELKERYEGFFQVYHEELCIGTVTELGEKAQFGSGWYAWHHNMGKDIPVICPKDGARILLKIQRNVLTPQDIINHAKSMSSNRGLEWALSLSEDRLTKATNLNMGFQVEFTEARIAEIERELARRKAVADKHLVVSLFETASNLLA